MQNPFKAFNSNARRHQKGMTLLEIMIVLVILGGLATILANTVQKRFAKSKVQQAKIQMAQIGSALDMYYTDCNSYPESLNSLLEASSDCSNWGPDPYIKSARQLKDPWDNEFVYENRGGSYFLKSLGEDRRDGGSGLGADITSEDQ